MVNDLMQRRQQLMQQTQAMNQQASQQSGGGLNLGKIAGLIGGAMSKRSDGKYGDTDLTKLDGYDKNLSDSENFAKLNPNGDTGVFADNYIGSVSPKEWEQKYGTDSIGLTSGIPSIQDTSNMISPDTESFIDWYNRTKNAIRFN